MVKETTKNRVRATEKSLPVVTLAVKAIVRLGSQKNTTTRN